MSPEVRLNHIGIYVKDLERSLNFYKETLGLHESYRFSIGEAKIAVINVSGSLLELIQRPGAPAKPPEGSRIHIAFHVRDFKLLEKGLEERGIQLRKAARDDGSSIAFFKDPDGHDIEIMEKGLSQ